MKLLLGILILPISVLLTNGDYLDPEKQRRINEVVEAVMDCWDIVGTQISVVHKGEVVFSNGYGLIDTDNEQPVTPQTLFNIASTSKQFTTTLLGIVLEENGYV